nr:hypothetical protein OH820_13610 [Streptomyces sp. NBC_00857]
MSPHVPGRLADRAEELREVGELLVPRSGGHQSPLFQVALLDGAGVVVDH